MAAPDLQILPAPESQPLATLLLAGENRVLSMLAQREPLQLVLEQICLLVEAAAPGCLVSILLLDEHTNRLRPVAAPSFPATYFSQLGLHEIGRRWGPCSIAACDKQQLVIPDVACGPTSSEFRELALRHGLHASWSTPILSARGSVLGTFGMTFRQVMAPTPEHQSLIGQMTHLTTIAIERAQVEELLRLNEACLSEAQQLSLTGSFWWSPATGAVTWSEQTYRIYEFSPELRPTLDLARQRLHPDDRALFEATARQAAQDKSDFAFEHRLLMPDGRIKHVRVVSRALPDASGLGCDYLGAVMDVSAGKKAQLALEGALRRTQDLKEQFRLALDTIPGLVWIALPDGYIDFLNKRWLEYTGLDLAQASGWGWVVAIHPLDLPGLEAYWRDLLVTRRPGETEARLRCFDGTFRWFLFRAVPFFNERGVLVHWYGQTTDIDARKRAEDALRGSEQFARGQVAALTSTLDALAREPELDKLMEHVLRTITEQLGAHSNSVWLRREAGSDVDFEFAFEDSRLVTRGEPLDRSISPAGATTELWPWAEAFATGKPCVLADIREETTFPGRDHLIAIGVITLLIVPMLMAGRVEGVIGIRFTHKRGFRPEELELAQALTNQALLAMQLTRLSARSRTAAVVEERNRMARDIHDTLAQGFTGVIVQMEAAADALAHSLIQEAEQHIDRAGELARDSLHEARRSVRALRPRVLEEKSLAEALQNLFSKMTDGTPVRAGLSITGVAQALPWEWDVNVLHICQEALTNALRHAEATNFSGRLDFGAEQLLLVLQDNGRGFAAAHKHEGFGLSGIRERVEAMRGTITIDSTATSGTSIAIALPLTDCSEP